MAEVLESGDHPPACVVSDGSLVSNESSKNDVNIKNITLTEHQDEVVKPHQLPPPSTVVATNVLSGTKSSDSPFDEPDYDDSPFDEKQHSPVAAVEQHAKTGNVSLTPTPIEEQVAEESEPASKKQENFSSDDSVEPGVAALETVGETGVDSSTGVEVSVEPPSTEVHEANPPSDEERAVETKKAVTQEEVFPSLFSVEMPETTEPKADDVPPGAAEEPVKVDDKPSSTAAVNVPEESAKTEKLIEQAKEPPIEEKKRPVSVGPENVAEVTDEPKEEVVEKEPRSTEPVPEELTKPEALAEEAANSIEKEAFNNIEPKNVMAKADESAVQTDAFPEAKVESAPTVADPIKTEEEINVAQAIKEFYPTEPFQETSKLEKEISVGLAEEPTRMNDESAVEAEVTPETREENNGAIEAIEQADNLAQDSVESERGISANEAKEKHSIADVEATEERGAGETIVLVAEEPVEHKEAPVKSEHEPVDEPKAQEVQQKGNVSVVEETIEQKETSVGSQPEPAKEPGVQEVQKEVNAVPVKESVEQKETPMQWKLEFAAESNVQEAQQEVNVSLVAETAVQEQDTHTDARNETAETKSLGATTPVDEEPTQEKQESRLEKQNQAETFTEALNGVETHNVTVPAETEKNRALSGEPAVTRGDITTESSEVEPVSPVEDKKNEVEADASRKAPISPSSKLTIPTAFSASKASEASESPSTTPSKVKVPSLFRKTGSTDSAEDAYSSPAKSSMKSPGKIMIPAAFLTGSSAPTPQTPTTPSPRKKHTIPVAFSAKIDPEDDDEGIQEAEEQAQEKAAEEEAVEKAEEEARKMADLEARQKAEEEAREQTIKVEQAKQKLTEEIERVEAELESAKVENELNASREMLMGEIAAVDAELEAAKVEKEMNASKDEIVGPSVQIDEKEMETMESSKSNASSQADLEVSPGLVKEVSKRLESPKPEKNKLVEQLHEQAISAANSEISQGEAHVKEIVEKIESPNGKKHASESVDVENMAVMPSLEDAPEDQVDSPAQERDSDVLKVDNTETEDAVVTATPPVSPSSLSTGSKKRAVDTTAQNQASSGGACGCECILL